MHVDISEVLDDHDGDGVRAFEELRRVHDVLDARRRIA
jgi:hypothetical protein